MEKEIFKILIEVKYRRLTLKDAQKLILNLFSVSNSAYEIEEIDEIEEKRDMEDFGNYAGIGFDDD